MPDNIIKIGGENAQAVFEGAVKDPRKVKIVVYMPVPDISGVEEAANLRSSRSLIKVVEQSSIETNIDGVEYGPEGNKPAVSVNFGGQVVERLDALTLKLFTKSNRAFTKAGS